MSAANFFIQADFCTHDLRGLSGDVVGGDAARGDVGNEEAGDGPRDGGSADLWSMEESGDGGAGMAGRRAGLVR